MSMNKETMMERTTPLCKQCPVCNGIACRGQIPGLGGIGQGNSFIQNVAALQGIKLNMDVLNNVKEIDTQVELFGVMSDVPICCAPIAGIKNNYGTDISDQEYNMDMTKACSEENILCFLGDGIDAETYFRSPAKCLHDHGGKGFLTIKPWKIEAVEKRFELVKEYSILGFAMDIDAAGLPLLRNANPPAENKDVEALKAVKALCGDKPFIVKGIMTKEAALLALSAGADGIVVSNHGGRVLDDTPGTIEVLAQIVEAVQGRMTVLVDGGFRTGNDVFKAIALGADAVLLGRPLALACATHGFEGAQTYIKKIKSEFIHAMRLTGCETISAINKSKIRG